MDADSIKFQQVGPRDRTPIVKLGGRHFDLTEAVIQTFFFLFFFVSVLPEIMYVHMCVWHPWRSEEDSRSYWTGVIDVYELPYGCKELNPIPLQE